jgi:hypothetical protein
MPSQRRSKGIAAGGLAGWLFADLALVLAFVFLDSTSSGQGLRAGDPGRPGVTTTTEVPGKDSAGENNGARPQPYKVTISASMDTSASTIIRRLESALARIAEGKDHSDEIYLVVIANGGSRGRDRSVGADLARHVANQIESRWDKVIRGQTFFVTGDTADHPSGVVDLKLFPAQVKPG